MFNIYATGDGRFMYEVFQSIALIFNSSSFVGLISVGFLLQVILLCFKAIQSQKLELHHVLFSFMLYGVMFIPKSDVAITDIHSSQTRVVGNVPIGLAALGELMSTAGFAITEIFEQNFAPISTNLSAYEGVLDDGFLAPLKMLLDLRDIPIERGDASNEGAENLRNYIAQCTLMKLDDDQTTIQRINQADDPWVEMQYPIYTSTMRYQELNTAGSSVMTCNEATSRISQDIANSGEFYQDVLRQINLEMGNDANAGAADIDSAIKQYIGVSVDSYKYIINSSISKVFSEGLQLGHQRRNNIAATIVIEEAKARRNVTYSAEAAVFATIMKPMMSFIEVLVYAVAPLMAFLLVAGPSGISLAAKYLTIGAWVQLWLPLLAIVKLYIYLVMTQQLDNIVTAQSAVHSITSQLAFNETFAAYISTASMLTSAVPAIALMLVYGGAVTATNLAGKISSSGFVNSSGVAPSTIAASAGAGQSGGITGAYDSGSKSTIYGRSDLNNSEAGNVSLSDLTSGTTNASIATAKTTANARVSDAASTLSQSSGYKELMAHGSGSSVGAGFTTSNSHDAVNQMMTDAGYSGSSGMSEQEKTTLALVASLGTGSLSKVFSMAVRALAEQGITSEKGMSSAFKDAISFSESEKGSAAFNETSTENYFGNRSAEASETVGAQKAETIRNSLSQADQITASAQALATEQASFKQDRQISAPAFEAAARSYAQSADVGYTPGQVSKMSQGEVMGIFTQGLAEAGSNGRGFAGMQDFLREHGGGTDRSKDLIGSLGRASSAYEQLAQLTGDNAQKVAAAGPSGDAGYAALENELTENATEGRQQILDEQTPGTTQNLTSGEQIAGAIEGGRESTEQNVARVESEQQAATNRDVVTGQAVDPNNRPTHQETAADLKQRSFAAQADLLNESKQTQEDSKGPEYGPGSFAGAIMTNAAGMFGDSVATAAGKVVQSAEDQRVGLGMTALVGGMHDLEGVKPGQFEYAPASSNQEQSWGAKLFGGEEAPQINPATVDTNRSIDQIHPASAEGKEVKATLTKAASSFDRFDDGREELQLEGGEHKQLKGYAERIESVLAGNSSESVGQVYEEAFTEMYGETHSPSQIREAAQTATNETLQGAEFINNDVERQKNAVGFMALSDSESSKIDFNGDATGDGPRLDGGFQPRMGALSTAQKDYEQTGGIDIEDAVGALSGEGSKYVPLYSAGENSGEIPIKQELDNRKEQIFGDGGNGAVQMPPSTAAAMDTQVKRLTGENTETQESNASLSQASAQYFSQTSPVLTDTNEAVTRGAEVADAIEGNLQVQNSAEGTQFMAALNQLQSVQSSDTATVTDHVEAQQNFNQALDELNEVMSAAPNPDGSMNGQGSFGPRQP